MKKRNLIWFTVMFLSVACNNPANDKDKKTFGLELAIQDTLNLKIDTLSRYDFPWRLSEFDNKEVLECLMYRQRKIHYYDLNINSGKPIKTIIFPKEGEFAIHSPAACISTSWDSIYIQSYQDENLFLLDSSKQIKNKWSVNTTEKTKVFVTAEFRPMVRKKNFIYLSTIPTILFEDSEYYNNSYIRKLNIQTRSLTDIPINWPEIYTKDKVSYGRYNEIYSMVVLSDERIVLSFPLDKSLYVYKDSLQIEIFDCKSNYVPEIPILPKFNKLDYEKEISYMVEIACFSNLYYDKFRELLYRVVLHASDLYDTEGNKIKYLNKPFSIQIIDAKTFELKGEQDFPGNTYDIQNIIPTKRGVLMSTCNENNPDLQEDRLQFVVLKIEEKKENEK